MIVWVAIGHGILALLIAGAGATLFGLLLRDCVFENESLLPTRKDKDHAAVGLSIWCWIIGTLGLFLHFQS